MISAMFEMVTQAPEKAVSINPVVEQIGILRQQQNLVDELFNFSDDEDIIEACCYQSKAFSAYYRYLLKQLRNKEDNENKTERIGGFVG